MPIFPYYRKILIALDLVRYIDVSAFGTLLMDEDLHQDKEIVMYLSTCLVWHMFNFICIFIEYCLSQ